MPVLQSRRRFLTLAALAGAAGLGGAGVAGLGAGGKSLAAEAPPEITTIRLKKVPVYCEAPLYIGEELLRAEGFTIRHVAMVRGEPDWRLLAHGDYDYGFEFAPDVIMGVDAGLPITILGGVHAGCFELFGNEGIRSIADLKNRT